MAERIKKKDHFYQEALIWMGYRYAIGLAGSKSGRAKELMDSFKLFDDIEFDSPAFHALAAEIANYLKRKKIKDVVDLSNQWMERDMMWYSAHYAVGSHSYAGSLCHDIVRYGSEVLSPERREFIAYDIRREITWHLNFPFSFYLPIDGERRLDPIDLLIRFLKENDIRTEEQMAKYKCIKVRENQNGEISYEAEVEKDETKRRVHSCLYDIHDLLGWDDLAKYFDPKMHKRCRIRYNGEEKVLEYFDSWGSVYGEPDAFPFRTLKKSIEEYAKNPSLCMYINEKYIVEDDI